ncbi:MAG: DUF4403 family protein [Polyangiaceae bacterium]|nr:DUF4403 family protein [Polyangiaceae bacterium]MCW5792146.1 DUF4403 family protein [Polyangiaceae bacterium]
MSRPRVARVVRFTRLAQAACFALLAGVSGCAGKGAEPTGAPGQCAVQLTEEAPELAAATPWRAPESRIGLELTADVALLRHQLERQVPRRLAQVKGQDVGAAGELSYRVDRGAFHVALDGDKLRVTTPVTAVAEVCKRLGPLCVTYGGCQPQLMADVQVPLVANTDYSLGEAEVKVGVTRGCVVLGVDQTGHVARAAREQQARVRRELDAARPDVRAAVSTGWRFLHTPVSLDSQICLRVAPSAIAQARPRLTELAGRSSLSTAFAVSGTVTVEQPCSDPHHAGPIAPLPPLQVVKDLPRGIDLQVPLRLDWSAVQAELSRGLTGQVLKGEAGDSQIAKLEVTPTASDGAPRAAVAVTLTGAVCGRAWFLAELAANPGGESVSLARLESLGEVPPGLDAAALATSLSQHGQVSVPLDLSAGASTLTSLVRRLTQDLPEEVRVDLQLDPARVTRVVPAAEGLMIVVGVRGQGSLVAE